MKNTIAAVAAGILSVLASSIHAHAEETEDQMRDQVKRALADADGRQLAHSFFSANCFNECWKFIDKAERIEEDVENMLLLANASLWHWKQRDDCKPQNLSIAYWQLGRVNCLAGDLRLARHYGKKCIDVSTKNGLDPFSLGYGYEVMADAAARDGQAGEAGKYLRLAREQLDKVRDKFNHGLLEADLERIDEQLKAREE